MRWIRKRVPFVIQGFAAGDPALAAVGNGPVDIVLVDADEPGSGTVFDWALADAVPPGVRLLLAGGLNAENVAQAIRRVRPVGRRRVDRGRDHARLRAQGRPQAPPRSSTRPVTRGRGARRRRLGRPTPDAAPYDWMADGA